MIVAIIFLLCYTYNVKLCLFSGGGKMKSIRAKIMWLLFGSVLISSLIIGTVGTILTSGVIEKSSTENMNLLCKTNADEVDIVLAKIEDSVNTLSHNALSELSDIGMLKDDSFRAIYSSNLGKNALHHIESIEGAMAIYIRYDPSYIGMSDGFFYVKIKIPKNLRINR